MLSEYMQARELLAEKKPNEAADKLTQVVKNLPDFRQAHYYLIIALRKSQQRQLARIAFEGYLRANPNDARGRELFDREFGERRDRDQALAAAQELVHQEDASATLEYAPS